MRHAVCPGWIAACCLAGALAAHAAEDDDQVRRAQLDAERTAAQARYDQAVRECERTFAVTGCIDRAKAERRATLERVAREQATLDDAQRRRRAEERRQRIAQKQARQAQQADAAASAAATAVQVRPPRASAAASATKPGRKFEPRSAEEGAAAEAEAARRAAQSQERRERAQAHQDAVRQRNAERAAQRAPAAPLPVPGASAAASAVR